MRKIELLLISTIVLGSIALASSPSKSYNNHSLSFEVPQNWSVVKDFQEGNDTQIVLSDGNNAIKIDLMKHQNINKIIGDYLEYYVSKAELSSYAHDIKNMTATDWHSAYDQIPWYSNDAISEYYMENVITPIALGGNNYHGSGISVKPDGVKYAGFFTNEYSPQRHSVDVYEWIIAWTKPNYDNEIIGVHSLFKGEFREIKLEMNGSNEEYLMPDPLWTVLTTSNREIKPLSKTSPGSSLTEMV